MSFSERNGYPTICLDLPQYVVYKCNGYPTICLDLPHYAVSEITRILHANFPYFLNSLQIKKVF